MCILRVVELPSFPNRVSCVELVSELHFYAVRNFWFTLLFREVKYFSKWWNFLLVWCCALDRAFVLMYLFGFTLYIILKLDKPHL